MTAVVVIVALLATGCSSDSGTPAPDSAHVLVGMLLETDTHGLAGHAEAVARPNGSSAGQFLTLADVAATYGAPADRIRAVSKQLGELGIDPEADPTGGVLWARVDVATAERVFDVSLDITELDDGTRAIEARGQPHVPDGLEGVRGVFGFSATAPDTPTGSVPTTSPGTDGCPDDVMTSANLASVYGLGDLVSGSSTGARTSVAVLAAGKYREGVYDAFNDCSTTTLDPATVGVSRVPGPSSDRSGVETSLDTVMIGLLAPEAEISVVEFDGASSIAFPLLQLLDDAERSRATPNALLITEGYCEDDRSTTELVASEWLLSALAVTGTTTVAASGDHGSTACAPRSDDPAVQYPASSAWVTSAGGASYTGGASEAEGLRVWNDVPDISAAGGGGQSQVIDRPSWQRRIDVQGSKRLVPDFAAYAEPSGLGDVPTCGPEGCTWQSLGGTSLAAAVLSAAVLLGAQQFAESSPVRFGHLAPGIHDDPDRENGAFLDITDGNNEIDTQKCCAATSGYDLASGWGLLDVAALVTDLDPAQPVRERG